MASKVPEIYLNKEEVEEALLTVVFLMPYQLGDMGVICCSGVFSLDYSLISREAEYMSRCKKLAQILGFNSMLNHVKEHLYGQSLQGFISIHNARVVVSS